MAHARLLDRLCVLYTDSTREELLALVMCGDVTVNGEKVRDPRAHVRPDDAIRVTGDVGAYVGRGGLKLEHALDEFGLHVAGRVFVDAGASTGGFTDCLLRRGARLVHAVDVGYNQLDFRLRTDDRVAVHERTNIMHVHSLDPEPDAAVADLSFRSLRGAARHLIDLVSEHWAVVLVKPQFEWASPPPGFDGTVPERELESILRQTLLELKSEGAFPQRLVESPIRGRKGNREYLLLLRAEPAPVDVERLLAALRS